MAARTAARSAGWPAPTSASSTGGEGEGRGGWRGDKRSLNQHNFIKISLKDIRAVSVRTKTTGVNILVSFELVLTVFRHPLNIKGGER